MHAHRLIMIKITITLSLIMLYFKENRYPVACFNLWCVRLISQSYYNLHFKSVIRVTWTNDEIGGIKCARLEIDIVIVWLQLIAARAPRFITGRN